MSYNGVKVAHIVATDINGCIGKAGQMPWHIPADLKRFRELTEGDVVVMGRKTFDSLGCKSLPNRFNIVLGSKLSFDDQYLNDMNLIFSHSLLNSMTCAATYAKAHGLANIWIIGGAEIYAQTMQYVDVIERTFIATEVNGGDAFYKPSSDFELMFAGDNLIDAKYDYWFTTWERKANG